ncbi:hypothetical protein FQN50_005516 [Emmonsiellopsis sp. PD_5]|nr:hypothetical protein FQN50_005516 [Emmonsiellopsis sp. PD_5]
MSRSIYDLLLKGQNALIKGQHGSYRVTKALKTSVFQAYICETNTPVLVKTAGHPHLYEQESDIYEFNCIRRSPYIRAIQEVIDNGTDKCMIFEWMDSDLWSLRGAKHELGPSFLKVTAKSVLEAVRVFADMDGQGAAVHTDINPNNILVSGAKTSTPIVKLADLEGVIAAGKFDAYRLQGLSIRAPEIWKGVSPTPACDVWSVGVSLAHFLASRALFGIMDKTARITSVPLETSQAAWAIGKIIQLLGPPNRDEDPKYTEEFDLAEAVVEMGIIKMGSLEEELGKVNAPVDCVEFIRYLLTLDHEKRPTAEQALQHPWLQTFDRESILLESTVTEDRDEQAMDAFSEDWVRYTRVPYVPAAWWDRSLHELSYGVHRGPSQ